MDNLLKSETKMVQPKPRDHIKLSIGDVEIRITGFKIAAFAILAVCASVIYVS